MHSLNLFTSNEPQIIESHFYKRRHLFFFTTTRLKITTHDGKTHDVAIRLLKNKSASHVPKKFFATKLNGQTILINKKSFEKRIQLSHKIIDQIEEKEADFSLETVMSVKENIAPLVRALPKSPNNLFWRQETAFKISLFVEENPPPLMEDGVIFDQMNDGRPYFFNRCNEQMDYHFDVSFVSKKKSHLLASGGFKRVYRYYNFSRQMDNTVVSIYRFKDEKNKRRAEFELNCHDIFSECPEIMHTKATLYKETSESSGFAAIAMKKFDGDFKNFIDNYDLATNLRAFRKVVHAVMFMHENNYVHRDLKFSNVMYRVRQDGELRIKLIDFGLACKINDLESLDQIVGSSYYMPPEVIGGEEKSDPKKIDSWALGIMLYRIHFNNRIPFADSMLKYYKNPKLSGKQKAARLKKDANLLIAKLNKNNDPWVQLIIALVQPNPEKRISVDKASLEIDELLTLMYADAVN